MWPVSPSSPLRDITSQTQTFALNLEAAWKTVNTLLQVILTNWPVLAGEPTPTRHPVMKKRLRVNETHPSLCQLHPFNNSKPLPPDDEAPAYCNEENTSAKSSPPIHQVRILRLREGRPVQLQEFPGKPGVRAEWTFSTNHSIYARVGREGQGEGCSISAVSLLFCFWERGNSFGVHLSCFLSPAVSQKQTRFCGQNARRGKRLDFISANVAKLYTLQRLPSTLAQCPQTFHSVQDPQNVNIFLSNDLKNWTSAIWFWKSL